MSKEKFMKLIGLDLPKVSYKDLEIELQQHFVKEYLLCLLLIVIDIVFWITSNMTEGALIGLACCVFYAGFITYMIMQVRCGLSSIIIGKCVDIEKDTKTILKQQIFGKSMMSVKCESDGLIYNVSVPHISLYKVGNIVKVYASPADLIQKNPDTIEISSPIFAMTIKNDCNS